MVLQRPHEEKHLSRSGFTDCGWRNVSTLIPVDSDTPDQSSDSAPSFAPANRTSPGYTERQTDRERDCRRCQWLFWRHQTGKRNLTHLWASMLNRLVLPRCDIISGAGGRLPGRWLCVSSGVHRVQEVDWTPSSSSWGWWRSLMLQPEKQHQTVFTRRPQTIHPFTIKYSENENIWWFQLEKLRRSDAFPLNDLNQLNIFVIMSHRVSTSSQWIKMKPECE